MSSKTESLKETIQVVFKGNRKTVEYKVWLSRYDNILDNVYLLLYNQTPTKQMRKLVLSVDVKCKVRDNQVLLPATEEWRPYIDALIEGGYLMENPSRKRFNVEGKSVVAYSLTPTALSLVHEDSEDLVWDFNAPIVEECEGIIERNEDEGVMERSEEYREILDRSKEERIMVTDGWIVDDDEEEGELSSSDFEKAFVEYWEQQGVRDGRAVRSKCKDTDPDLVSRYFETLNDTGDFSLDMFKGVNVCSTPCTNEEFDFEGCIKGTSCLTAQVGIILHELDLSSGTNFEERFLKDIEDAHKTLDVKNVLEVYTKYGTVVGLSVEQESDDNHVAQGEYKEEYVRENTDSLSMIGVEKNVLSNRLYLQEPSQPIEAYAIKYSLYPTTKNICIVAVHQDGPLEIEEEITCDIEERLGSDEIAIPEGAGLKRWAYGLSNNGFTYCCIDRYGVSEAAGQYAVLSLSDEACDMIEQSIRTSSTEPSTTNPTGVVGFGEVAQEKSQEREPQEVPQEKPQESYTYDSGKGLLFSLEEYKNLDYCTNPKSKVVLDLESQNGNIYNLIGYTVACLRQAGEHELAQYVCAEYPKMKSYGEVLVLFSKVCYISGLTILQESRRRR